MDKVDTMLIDYYKRMKDFLRLNENLIGVYSDNILLLWRRIIIIVKWTSY